MMNKAINDKQFMLNILIISSLLMFISFLLTVFIGSPKIMAIGITLWMIVLGRNMYLLYGKQFAEMKHYHDETIEQSKKDGNFGEYTIRSIVFPMCMIGIGTIIISLMILLGL